MRADWRMSRSIFARRSMRSRRRQEMMRMSPVCPRRPFPGQLFGNFVDCAANDDSFRCVPGYYGSLPNYTQARCEREKCPKRLHTSSMATPSASE